MLFRERRFVDSLARCIPFAITANEYSIWTRPPSARDLPPVRRASCQANVTQNKKRTAPLVRDQNAQGVTAAKPSFLGSLMPLITRAYLTRQSHDERRLMQQLLRDFPAVFRQPF